MAAALLRSFRIAVAGCLLSGAVGCAASPGAPAWPGLDAEPGQRLTVLSEATVGDPDKRDDEDFYLFAAVAMPDGTVAVYFDPRAPAVGSDGGDGKPQTVILGVDGARTPVAPGMVDGLEVDPQLIRPVAAAPDGTLYLFDPAARRIVAGVPGGQWRTVTELAGSGAWGPPKGAIGPGGELYYLTASSVLRVDPDGTETLIAGIDSPEIRSPGYNDLGQFPRPATSAPLPEVTGVVVGLDGTVYIATGRTDVLSLHDGILDLVPGTGPRQLPMSTLDSVRRTGVHYISSLAMDTDGALLLGDSGQAQVLRLADGHTERVDSDTYAVAEGQNVALSPNRDLIIITNTTYALALIGR